MKSFASDNYAGIDPDILQAIIEANQGHVPSYGNDEFTHKAIELLKKSFGEDSVCYFVFNGTAANTLSLKAITRSHQSIICADSAHIASQEVGSVVNLCGCSLVIIPNKLGKISVEDIQEAYSKATMWGRHNNKPCVVSIAQTTEFGTIYSLDELREISSVCKKNNMLLHIDGCRLANAAVSLGKSLKEITKDIGADVITFGGTKNGMLFGEAIIFFRKELADEFEYIQKQGLQLSSKTRFLSAQFIPYLEKNIWHKNALHANQMCLKLAEGLKKNPEIKLAYPVESNQIFAYFPKDVIDKTLDKIPYYVWDEQTNLVRLVTSFDTTESEIDKFIKLASI